MASRFMVLLAALLIAAAPQDRGRGRMPRQGKGPDEGKPAPDFKLKLLKEEGDEDEEPEYVQLSSFKDKRPVVLIFGSYT